MLRDVIKSLTKGFLRITIEDSIARDFPSGSDGKEFTCNAGDLDLISGSGRSYGERIATHSSILGFPGGSDGKEFTCNAGDLGSIPGLGRSPGERNGYPCQ